MAVGKLPTHEAMVKRICRRHEGAADAVREAGAIWYPSEADLIAAIGARHGLARKTSIDAYAVLSPKTGVTLARDAFEAHAYAASMGMDQPRTAALGRQSDKAWLLLHDNYAIHECVRGPKVEAFACNLLGCTSRVTVDTWAARVAGAWAWRGSLAEYRKVEAAYLTAARRLDVEPATLQAVVWLATRGVTDMDRRHPTAWSDLIA